MNTLHELSKTLNECNSDNRRLTWGGLAEFRRVYR